MQRLKVRLVDRNYDGRYAMFIYYEDNGHIYQAKPIELEFEQIEEGAVFAKPTLVLGYYDDSLFRSLVDELHRLKLIPIQTTATDGELKATKFHLEDMRTLAGVKGSIANTDRIMEHK